jgi:hypothetical protein
MSATPRVALTPIGAHQALTDRVPERQRLVEALPSGRDYFTVKGLVAADLPSTRISTW